MSVIAVILTFNEEVHVARALNSVLPFVDGCLVVDSGSTDSTVEIATELGATVAYHPFVNQARQFNYALTKLPADCSWVLRLDADEYVSRELGDFLKNGLKNTKAKIDGLVIERKIVFLGKEMRWGGASPSAVLRIFRFGRGFSQDIWMDEHIVVDGDVAQLDFSITDHNLKSISWWIEKHNAYSTREAIQYLLDKEGSSSDQPGDCKFRNSTKSQLLKHRVYYALPSTLRSLLYFFYRYVIRGGFLDGYQGTAFHFLQGFWYRYLVDLKINELERVMLRDCLSIRQAIEQELDVVVDD